MTLVINYMSLLLAVFIFVGIMITFIISIVTPRSKSPPVAPFGMLRIISEITASGKLPQFLLNISRTLSPVFQLNVPELNPFVVICDSNLAKIILEGDDNNFIQPGEKTYHYKPFNKITCGRPGLFTKRTVGEGWEWARKGVAPSFSTVNLNKKLSKLYEVLNELTSILDKKSSSGASFDISSLLVNFTFDFITISMFDSNFHAIQGSGCQIMEEIQLAIKEFGIKQNFNPLRFLCFWLPEVKRAKKSLLFIEEFLTNIMKNHRKNHTEEELQRDTSIMGHLLRSPYANDRDRCADMLGFIIGGYDTIGYTLSWIIIEVARHPVILKQIQRELDSVNPHKNTPFTPTHFSQLEYLSRVIQEGMRLHAVALFASVRKANRDLPYLGMTIKKGSSLFLAQYCYFRRGIRDPDSFIPDRWKSDDPDAQTLKSWPSPFSSGLRNCVGQNLARLELALVLSTLFRNYSFELLDDNVCSEYSMSNKPVNAFMRVYHRGK